MEVSKIQNSKVLNMHVYLRWIKYQLKILPKKKLPSFEQTVSSILKLVTQYD